MKRWREDSDKKKYPNVFFTSQLDNLPVTHPCLEENGHGSSGALDEERGGDCLTGEPLRDPWTLRMSWRIKESVGSLPGKHLSRPGALLEFQVPDPTWPLATCER